MMKAELQPDPSLTPVFVRLCSFTMACNPAAGYNGKIHLPDTQTKMTRDDNCVENVPISDNDA